MLIPLDIQPLSPERFQIRANNLRLDQLPPATTVTVVLREIEGKYFAEVETHANVE